MPEAALECYEFTNKTVITMDFCCEVYLRLKAQEQGERAVGGLED